MIQQKEEHHNRRVAGLHEGTRRMQPDFNAPLLDVFALDTA